ncbi:MAG TPA: hypothetical protein DCP63_05705 [Bacteroidetes bacterium]|nr:hypothetical protein [Bacteroidota bacterium]
MRIRPETAQFLRKLERSSKRKLHYPDEVGRLIDLSREINAPKAFEDAIFQAKFLAKSYVVMKRIGREGQGYDRLAMEFQSSLEKTMALLKVIVEKSPGEFRKRFEESFFSLEQDALSNLMKLLVDLSAVKNWMLDGKPLP